MDPQNHWSVQDFALASLIVTDQDRAAQSVMCREEGSVQVFWILCPLWLLRSSDTVYIDRSRYIPNISTQCIRDSSLSDLFFYFDKYLCQ
jgi:hypothetical protein